MDCSSGDRRPEPLSQATDTATPPPAGGATMTGRQVAGHVPSGRPGRPLLQQATRCLRGTGCPAEELPRRSGRWSRRRGLSRLPTRRTDRCGRRLLGRPSESPRSRLRGRGDPRRRAHRLQPYRPRSDRPQGSWDTDRKREAAGEPLAPAPPRQVAGSPLQGILRGSPAGRSGLPPDRPGLGSGVAMGRTSRCSSRPVRRPVPVQAEGTRRRRYARRCRSGGSVGPTGRPWRSGSRFGA